MWDDDVMKIKYLTAGEILPGKKNQQKTLQRNKIKMRIKKEPELYDCSPSSCEEIGSIANK